MMGLLVLVAAISLLTGCNQHPVIPTAHRGILDLSQWSFEQRGSIGLDGEWEFFWRQLLTPADFASALAPSGYMRVPGSWSTGRADGAHLSPDGYATYRLTLRLPDRPQPLAVFVPYVSTSYRLWIDGQLLATNGVVAAARSGFVPQFRPAVAVLFPRGHTVEIILQVTNFDFRLGGITNQLQLGTVGQVIGEREARLLTDAMIMGGGLIIAVYHLILYRLHRRDESALYFGLLCLSAVVRQLVTGQALLRSLYPVIPWAIHLRIEYLTDYLVLPLLLALWRSMFPADRLPAADRIFAAGAVLGALVTLVGPIHVASRLIIPYELFLILALVYLTVVVIRAAARRRPAARLFAAGGVIFFATICWDMLIYNQVLQGPRLIPWGLLFLLLFESAVLAKRFSATFYDLQDSRRLLTEREEHLRREIAEMLHGRVQSRLLVAEMALAQIDRLAGHDPLDVQSLCQSVRTDLRRLREEEIREASHLLHPSIIRVGLIPAARYLAESFRAHVQVEVAADAELAALDDSLRNGLPESIRLTAYRILEETLGNVCAHAQASRVEITLGLTRGQTGEPALYLRVRDDGCGLDSRHLKPGLGLRAIAARVGEHGGRWEISGGPGRGTALSAWIPFDPDRPTTGDFPAGR